MCVCVCLPACLSVCVRVRVRVKRKSLKTSICQASVNLDSPEFAPPVVISGGISCAVLRARARLCVWVELRPVIFVYTLKVVGSS